MQTYYGEYMTKWEETQDHSETMRSLDLSDTKNHTRINYVSRATKTHHFKKMGWLWTTNSERQISTVSGVAERCPEEHKIPPRTCTRANRLLRSDGMENNFDEWINTQTAETSSEVA